MNRRYFFSAALAAATASRTRVMAASDQVNVAVIGVGGRGRAIINDYRQVPGANIRYLCDADQASLEKAMAITQKFNMPKPQTTTDMRRVLEDKTIDAVSIATPDHWHGPATILACDAGKDVYVEK